MSLREFYAALYAKFPPEEKVSTFETNDPFFTDEELEVFAELESQVKH